MFNADRQARQGEIKDWTEIAKAYARRRRLTRELLESGELKTRLDFYAAAFIFQQAQEPDDYLLAHALAVRSLGLGMPKAPFNRTRTDIRHSISILCGGETTQGRYNDELLTDQFRAGAAVEPREQQAAKLESMNTVPQEQN